MKAIQGTRNFLANRSSVIAVAVSGILAAGTISSVLAIRGDWAWAASGRTPIAPIQNEADEGSPAEEIERPPHTRWVHPATGRFYVPVYDDRQLSDEQKAANPVYDPRWDPFARCISGSGFPLDPPPAGPFGQSDMDRLVTRVNEERPDANANKQIDSGDDIPGRAGAFLVCADEWLALSPEELKSQGLTP